MSENSCYHCGLPVPSNIDFTVSILGQPQSMCCPGCQAVAMAIVDGGLEKFYRYRQGVLDKPAEDDKKSALAFYDLKEVQDDFVTLVDNGHCSAQFVVLGVTCSACAWLIENYLSKLKGIEQVSVNLSLHRAHIVWNQSVIKLSDIMRALDAIGYQARPAEDEQIAQLREQENKHYILRLGVAGLAMMQAGMVAIGLYAGDYYGIESRWQNLLQWVSFILVTPVVFYSASPFFTTAWRSIKVKHLVMDVPVSLAIGLAYSASTWATISGYGEVYFDSVSMFTFFLLLGRYLEMRVRHRNETASKSLRQLIPASATRLREDGEEIVAIKSLAKGDVIRVSSGEIIPCDGEVLEGKSETIEAVLTGEQKPVVKNVGHTVCAGTINVANPLQVKVFATGTKTRLGLVLNLAESVDAEKPAQIALADRLAGWFVAAVLIVSVVVGATWWYLAPAKALWVVLSILVVTCPCALSLATPAALTVATGALRRRGFLIRKSHVLETLANVNHCVFDKTGTLTLGDMRIKNIELLSDVNQDTVKQISAGLEKGSVHPIGKAFQARSIQGMEQSPVFTQVKFSVGEGVAGEWQGIQYALGKPEFVLSTLGFASTKASDYRGLLLGSEQALLARIELEDEIREGAKAAINSLQQRNIAVELLSGDQVLNVEALAKELQITDWQGGATPSNKLAHVKQLQKQGKRVLMVGDGINDVPVLSAADISVAMGNASDIAQLHADSVLISGNLSVLTVAVDMARRCSCVIKQNFAWALLYNLVALPMACMGLIPPWAAAIGMSSSSLLVVLNSLRLNKVSEPQAAI